MKQKLLPLIALLVVSQMLFGQATINCFTGSDDYHTGTTDGSSFTETSLIRTTEGTEAGWARFDISGIPEGSTIQSVELHLYVALDNYAYWNINSIDDDPLLGTASSVFTDCTDGITYATWTGNFPEPSWYVTDLGSTAVTDLQDNMADQWFAVGVWEFEGGSYYSITCDGWNESNPPYLVVTYLVPGAPLPAYNPYPPHNSFSVDPTVDLTWDFGDETETYDLYFGTEFPPVTKVVDNATSGASGSYDPGTMDFTTTYHWQVVSKNTAELETPGPIWTFTTACDAWALPIFEDFSLVTPPEIPYCWTGVVNSYSTWATVQTLPYAGIDDGPCVYLYNSDDPDAEVLLISPLLEDGAAGKYVNFYGWGYGDVSVGSISDPADPSTYSEIATFDLVPNWIDYQEYDVYFTSYTGTDAYIAFKLETDNWYQDIYLDNIMIDYPPTCPKPNALVGSDPTTSSIILDWSENGDADTWEIEYGYAGFVPSGEPMATVTEHPYTLEGLDSGTKYDWYVRAYCSEDDQSYWSSKSSFTTLCEPFDVPVMEDFDDAAIPELPPCWLPLLESTSPWAYIQTIGWNSYSYPNSLYMYNSDDPEADVILVSPTMVDPVSDLWINFWAFGYAPQLIVGTISDPLDASTFTEYATVDLTFSWQEFDVYFTDYSGTDEFIAIKVGYSDWYQDIYIDNITIDYPPTCPKPTGLQASDPTTTSVILNWLENGEATTWDIEYGLAGFTPTGVPSISVTDLPYTLSGLDSGTEYDWYIRAYCSEDDQSYWSSVSSFTTLCEPFDVPVMEFFDDVYTPEIPVCWSPLIESTSQWAYIETISWYNYSSPNSLYIYNSNDPEAVMMLVSPMMVDPVNTLWINFFARTYYAGPELVIGTVSDPLDPSTFTEIGSVALTGNWQEYEVFLDDYAGSDEFLAIKGGFTDWYQEIYVDNITIDYPPTCPKPSGLYAEDASQTSIMLGWNENGAATQWNIEYGYAGFTPTGVGNAIADSNPFELTDLEDGTHYEFYVQADCGEDDESYWVGPRHFQTLCYPTVLAAGDYIEDFEGLTPPLAPPCIAIENSNYDEVTWQSSYMNPNSGLSHMSISYSSQPMDDWFFSAPLQLIGGQTYNVSFYYGNNYEWYVEKLEVQWGDAPSSDAMTGEVIFDDPNITTSGAYLEGTASFTPPDDGVYFVGWHGYSQSWMYDLYVDDIFIEWDNSLVVTASADPETICQGAESQLYGGAVGGSGNYTYSWTSDPPGFTSSEPNPVVSPDVTTDYILEVNDSFVSIFDTVTVYVTSLPGVPGTPSGLTYFCASWGTATYSTSGASGANSYDWVITPEEAATLTGSGTSVSVDWTEGWLGQAQLKVIGMHDGCAGPESAQLTITVYLPTVTLTVPEMVCIDDPAFELTGGTPAGGTYSGPGVNDEGWFDPAVAGIGEHLITYTYSDVSDCENSAEATILVDPCTGIGLNNGDMYVAINPNPNNGTFTLTVRANNAERVNIRVMDNYGEEVYHEKNVELHSNYSTQVDLSSYAKGLYYLYIYSDEVNYVEKIIVK